MYCVGRHRRAVGSSILTGTDCGTLMDCENNPPFLVGAILRRGLIRRNARLLQRATWIPMTTLEVQTVNTEDSTPEDMVPLVRH